MPNGDDHDLLIKIDTTMDHVQSTLESHISEEKVDHNTIKKDIKAAHKRIDWLTVSGVLALLFLGITIWMKA